MNKLHQRQACLRREHTTDKLRGFALVGPQRTAGLVIEGIDLKFYEGLPGIMRVAKPSHLEASGGCWFESEAVRIHLGVKPDFRSGKKAHPAPPVQSLDP